MWQRTVTLLVLSLLALRSSSAEAAPITIIDTLGVATPAPQFDPHGPGGSSGPSIGASDFGRFSWGPFFALRSPTVITEIGGFVETCLEICSGLILPAFVEVYPSVQGLPDLDSLIASFTLSNDANPDLVSYESTSPGLLLEPGAYFAVVPMCWARPPHPSRTNL